jgi:Protein of unknown function (DUF2442)
MTIEYHVSKVDHLGGYRLRLTFAGGLVADVDLTTKLRGDVGPMFKPLRDESFFALVAVDEDLGTIVWPNGADLAPDVLYKKAMGAA